MKPHWATLKPDLPSASLCKISGFWRIHGSTGYKCSNSVPALPRRAWPRIPFFGSRTEPCKCRSMIHGKCFDDEKAARRAEKQSLKVARNVELAMTSQTWWPKSFSSITTYGMDYLWIFFVGFPPSSLYGLHRQYQEAQGRCGIDWPMWQKAYQQAPLTCSCFYVGIFVAWVHWMHGGWTGKKDPTKDEWDTFHKGGAGACSVNRWSPRLFACKAPCKAHEGPCKLLWIPLWILWEGSEKNPGLCCKLICSLCKTSLPFVHDLPNWKWWLSIAMFTYERGCWFYCF